VCLPLQALYALVQKAGCDIRSCLNTLQLLAKQAASLQPSRAKGGYVAHVRAKQVRGCARTCSKDLQLARAKGGVRGAREGQAGEGLC